MKVIIIYRCIYTKKDENEATFDSAEHIFPKCIGGKCCLPKGFVSDQTNNFFSKAELQFARENPAIVVNRIFIERRGRRKHKNRNKIAVFTDKDGVSLGYIDSCKPSNISQIIFINIDDDTSKAFSVKILIDAMSQGTYEERFLTFISHLKTYNRNPMCIKSKNIPDNTYLLGVQDGRWFLGVNKSANPENIKTLLDVPIRKTVAHFETHTISSESINTNSNQITANFQFEFSIEDMLRIHAKIAFNVLSVLQGQEYILSDKFDDLRDSILTGNGISEYVHILDGESVLKGILEKFSERVAIGDKCHSVVITTIKKTMYAFVSLYGANHQFVVDFGKTEKHIVDMYICDWQHNKEYKLIDYVSDICKFNHEAEMED